MGPHPCRDSNGTSIMFCENSIMIDLVFQLPAQHGGGEGKVAIIDTEVGLERFHGFDAD